MSSPSQTTFVRNQDKIERLAWTLPRPPFGLNASLPFFDAKRGKVSIGEDVLTGARTSWTIQAPAKNPGGHQRVPRSLYERTNPHQFSGGGT